ncbi:phosphoadenosine phosphosulfate reductase [Xylariomycetidae sp. FL2044]|nr:phosphoadenosine phosphosulfate reductase [Xylariomycetidae sp. FL2044]
MGPSPLPSGASSPRSREQVNAKDPAVVELESGYVSGASSTDGSSGCLPQVTLTRPHIKHLNQQLERMTPQDRLRFCTILFPNLYQSTAFGLTGLVTIDMLSKLRAESPETLAPIDAIFFDTLYHFRETYDLVDKVQAKYPNIRIHVYKPDNATTTAEFEERYGERLYETASELYDWIAKVEPQQRSYAELNVAAVLTGRRRSQGGERDKIGVIEVDDERGIVKINPLVDWSFAQVKAYITEHQVPYNELLDRGYKSVGDWHSTSPVAAGEDERAGRWKGQAKTECGIHNKKSRYAQFLENKQRKAEEEQLSAALQKVEREQREQQPIEADTAETAVILQV